MYLCGKLFKDRQKARNTKHAHNKEQKSSPTELSQEDKGVFSLANKLRTKIHLEQWNDRRVEASLIVIT